jgi:hypothetical protein
MARGKQSKLQKKAQEAQKEKQNEQETQANDTPEPRRRRSKVDDSQKIQMSKVTSIRKRFEKFVSEYEDDLLRSRLVLSNGVPLPQDNKELFMYEEQLLKFMMELDQIQADHDAIRQLRKRVIVSIQEHLKIVDEYKHNPKNCDLPVYTKTTKKRKEKPSDTPVIIGILY